MAYMQPGYLTSIRSGIISVGNLTQGPPWETSGTIRSGLQRRYPHSTIILIANELFPHVERYQGANTNPNRIYGYDEERTAENIRFENLRINGELILRPEQGNFVINEYARGVSFHKIEEDK